MNLGLDLSLKLQQKLSFQMIQSLKLLQVNALQLEQMLRTELEMNPVLESHEDLQDIQDEEQHNDEADDSSEDGDLEVGEDEIDWEEYLEEGFDLGYSRSEETEPDREHREATVAYQVSLEEHLTRQLAERKLSRKRSLLVQFIIGCIEPDGYLRVSMDQIADATSTNAFEVEEALNIVQNMEPAGVGARSLRECLLLQLRRRGLHDSIAIRIVSEAWGLLERLRIPEIATRFGVTPAVVQSELEVLKKLSPKPGYLVSAERPQTIVPDLIVREVEGKFVVTLNDRSIPSLHISRAYVEMLKRGSKVKKDVKKYIRDKFNGATWLIRSIEQRKSTMLRVMYAIIDKQKEFFEKGPSNLAPMKLQDVADMVGMHISTVSRVTSNKYVQTPHGIFELKYFFTEALGQQPDGTDISTARIKNRLRELVEGENTGKPLSDQRLSDILGREGLKVARRTVAKYREQLKILPARLRQKYN